MARTTSSAVQAILGSNYDGTTSLSPFIEIATALIDRVNTCATSKGITLTSTELELLERWMSAWYYTKMDPMYQQRSTLRASGSFIVGKEEPETYKAAAMSLDPSGCLRSLTSGRTMVGAWGGKPFSEQLSYEERN